MARIHEADEKESQQGAIAAAFSNAAGFLQGVKRRLDYELNDDDRFAFNMKLLRALGLFGGSILLMSNFGDIMAAV